MNRALLLLTALLLSCQGALAQSGGQKAWDETLKAARQEGKVVVAGHPEPAVWDTRKVPGGRNPLSGSSSHS